jgi:hypothetical protein
MKRLSLILSAVLISAAAFAQGKQNFAPKSGDWSVGINVNPVAAGGIKYQPKSGEFVGAFLGDFSGNPQQMYMTGQPLVSIKAKKMLTGSLAFKMTLGFGGSYIDYNEYVTDDYARSLNSVSEDVVSDHVLGNIGTATLTAGIQKMFGTGNLKFTIGADVLYTISGGNLRFSYGNDFEPYNKFKPTTMGMCDMTSTPGENMNYYDSPALGIDYARPAKRNELGTVQQVGLVASIGLEYFLAEHISIGAEVSIVPVAFTWQGQTWGVYEGYSNVTNTVLNYNMLVSKGSRALTYGTSNLGVNLSVNYYF